MLPVEAGEKGLRQSEALYKHLINLPSMFKEMEGVLGFSLAERLAVVAVSEKPCRRDESYMPVFRAGYGFGQAIASSLGVPLVASTHQEGHLMSALWSAGIVDYCRRLPFLAYHLSGGTNELILVKDITKSPFAFEYESIAASLDITAGQLIDRVGQCLGLPFPAGPYLEKLGLSLGGESPPRSVIPTFCRAGNISLSGGEAWAKRAVAAGSEPSQIARSIEHYIASSLCKSIVASETQEPQFILFMGGVAANAYIRWYLKTKLARRFTCLFAEPEYCGDNGLGAALIGLADLACSG